MSRSSIKPSTSPTIADDHDDELAAGAEQGSYHEAVREDGEGVRPEAGGSSHGAQQRSSRTIMNYPVDENLFYTTPTQPAFPESETDAEGVEYEEPAPGALIHPPDFKPFFTLLEDPGTGEYIHPTVHYMFADDDPEILTSAVLDTLDRDEGAVGDIKATNETEQRYVVVDMAADGKSIVSASSLSAEWQALQTSITQAPSWGEAEDEGAERGLMLKISGRYKRAADVGRDGKRQQEVGGNIEELVRIYGERLDKLDEILGRS